MHQVLGRPLSTLVHVLSLAQIRCHQLDAIPTSHCTWAPAQLLRPRKEGQNVGSKSESSMK